MSPKDWFQIEDILKNNSITGRIDRFKTLLNLQIYAWTYSTTNWLSFWFIDRVFLGWQYLL